jgi:tetratricopeptide (TPR) repeat protein
VISWSYQALTTPVARLFRLLGLHAGPDISTAAAASLAGCPVGETRRLLTELARANLVIEHRPGRYTFHDLLRAYAADLAHRVDPDHTRQAALGRLLDHYTNTAHRADRLLYPTRDPIPLPLGSHTPGAGPEHPADHQQAMAWLTIEHPVLLATVRAAANAGFDLHTWQLTWCLDTFLAKRGHRQDQSAAWQLALRAAERLDDPVAQATALRLHAHADIQLGAHADADTHLRRALDLYTRAGDLVGQAHTQRNLAYLRQRQGNTEEALDHAERSLALCQAAGHHRGEADALNVIGWYHAQLGAYAHALVACERALSLSEQVADRHGQAAAWDSLGYVRHQLGHHPEAADCYQHALTLLRDLGDRHHEAGGLIRLGDTHHAAGDPAAARAAWSQALTIFTELDHPDAQTVRTKLDTVDPPG